MAFVECQSYSSVSRASPILTVKCHSTDMWYDLQYYKCYVNSIAIAYLIPLDYIYLEMGCNYTDVSQQCVQNSHIMRC